MTTQTGNAKLVCSTALAVIAVFAGISQAKISIGLSFHSGSHHHCSPYRYPRYHHGVCCSRYLWLDRGYYHWLDSDRYCFSPRHRYYYHRRPYRSSGVSIYISDIQSVIDGIRGKSSRSTAKKAVSANAPGREYWTATGKTGEQLRAEVQLNKPDLLEMIGSPQKKLRTRAVDGLADFSFDAEIRRAMEKVLLSDPEPDLRRKAARALGKATNTEVLPALQKAKAADPNHGVRQQAYRSIILVKGY